MTREESSRINKEMKEHLECTVQCFEFKFTIPTEHDKERTYFGTEEELKSNYPGARITATIPLDS